jgi:hypothetical protein
VAREEEEFSWIEDEPVGEAIQSEPGPEIDMGGLTPIRSWPPDSYPYFYRFKYAAVCHDIFNDVYGIAAVFQKKSGSTYWDNLYYLRIDGNSTHPKYGQVLTNTFIATSTRIDNVDCTTSTSGSTIFITYDMYNSDARWVRFVGSTMSEQYTIVGVDYCDEYEAYVTRKPRIAFSNTSYSTIMIAFYAYDFSVDGSSCEICTHTYSAYTGEFIHEEMFWPDTSNQPVTWDVEWNGDSKFILAYFNPPDYTAPYILRSARLTGNGYLDHVYEIENFMGPGDHPQWPSEMKLAYTNGNLNSTHRFILQTAEGATWWLEQWGEEIDDTHSPRYYYGGKYGDHFAVCEYWGSTANRIAHTFGYNFSMLPPVMNTRHMHWDQAYIEASPHEVFSLNDGYYPAACSAGDTLTDTELMLVSSAAGGSKYVYWNMESQ